MYLFRVVVAVCGCEYRIEVICTYIANGGVSALDRPFTNGACGKIDCITVDLVLLGVNVILVVISRIDLNGNSNAITLIVSCFEKRDNDLILACICNTCERSAILVSEYERVTVRSLYVFGNGEDVSVIGPNVSLIFSYAIDGCLLLRNCEGNRIGFVGKDILVAGEDCLNVVFACRGGSGDFVLTSLIRIILIGNIRKNAIEVCLYRRSRGSACGIARESQTVQAGSCLANFVSKCQCAVGFVGIFACPLVVDQIFKSERYSVRLLSCIDVTVICNGVKSRRRDVSLDGAAIVGVILGVFGNVNRNLFNRESDFFGNLSNVVAVNVIGNNRSYLVIACVLRSSNDPNTLDEVFETNCTLYVVLNNGNGRLVCGCIIRPVGPSLNCGSGYECDLCLGNFYSNCCGCTLMVVIACIAVGNGVSTCVSNFINRNVVLLRFVIPLLDNSLEAYTVGSMNACGQNKRLGVVNQSAIVGFRQNVFFIIKNTNTCF